MNWLDWLLLILLAFSAISGLWKGLIRTALDLAGLALGIWLAGRFYARLAPVLDFIPQENLAKIAAFVIITGAVMLVAYILGVIFKKIVSLLTWGWIDRLAGAILGLALGALLLGAALALLAKYPFLLPEQAIRDSWLASLLLKSFPLVRGLLPAEFDSLRGLFR